jgi:hypothetical protein
MNSIVRNYLAYAFANTSRLSKLLNRESLTPIVAMWQEDNYLVVATCDGYRQHEFRLLMFRDDGSSPTLLHEHLLAFSPAAIAAAARTLDEKLDEADSLNIHYDDDQTTISLLAPGITISLKATESQHKDHIRRFAATFTEVERLDVIKVNAKEFLSALPKPRRNNERMHMLVHFHNNTWQAGMQPELNNWQPTGHSGTFNADDVQGTPDCKLNVQMLREALEVAERYHPFAKCTIALTKRNEPALVRVEIGEVLYYKAYIMPIVKIPR